MENFYRFCLSQDLACADFLLASSPAEHKNPSCKTFVQCLERKEVKLMRSRVHNASTQDKYDSVYAHKFY